MQEQPLWVAAKCRVCGVYERRHWQSIGVYRYGKMIARKNMSIRQVMCLIKVCVGAWQYNNDDDVMAFDSSYEYKCASQRMYVYLHVSGSCERELGNWVCCLLYYG